MLRDCDCLHDVKLWLGLILSGMLSFLVNISVFLQIKYMSPLLNNMSVTIKV